MRRSSRTYSARIRPERRLRQAVLGCGLLCGAAGTLVAFTMPVWPAVRAAVALSWTLFSLREFVVLRRVYRGCFGYQVFATGEIEVFGDGGRRLHGTVLPGTVVFGKWAWLRVRLDDSRRWGELLTGDARESQQWRRFQVIFRHLNAC